MTTLLAIVPLAEATPVTLRFDATIGTVFAGVPFDSGIDFGVGDVVSGRFTCEPAVGDGSTTFAGTQAHNFVLNVNEIELATPSFEIESLNDIPITDFAPANEIDWLKLGAADLSPTDPMNSVSIDPSESGFRMNLFGPTTAIPIASFPADATVWSSFNLWRELTVFFNDGIGGAIGFQATVGQFVAVPEPPTFILAVSLSIAALTSHRHKIFRFRQRR